MFATLNHTVSQKVAEIFDLYTELHGVRISFFGPDRKLLYPAEAGRSDCSCCRMLRDEPGLASRCRLLDRTMMDRALSQRAAIRYTCHGGLHAAAAPLFFEDRLAGCVIIGQFRRPESPAVSPYAELNGDALPRACGQAPMFPEEKIEVLLAMLSRLLELILLSQRIPCNEYDLIGPVISLIQSAPDRRLTLEEAARMVERSPSTVTRMFKKATGKSFKQYQVDSRLKRAVELLEMQPARPVSEVARLVGFEDPFYFSRLFHKYTGRSPRNYRLQQSGRTE